MLRPHAYSMQPCCSSGLMCSRQYAKSLVCGLRGVSSPSLPQNRSMKAYKGNRELPCFWRQNSSDHQAKTPAGEKPVRPLTRRFSANCKEHQDDGNNFRKRFDYDGNTVHWLIFLSRKVSIREGPFWLNLDLLREFVV